MEYSAKFQPKFTICTAIRKMLLEDEKLKELVGNKVYPIIAPENITTNYIVYQRDEYSIDRVKQGISNQNCIVFITCVSSDYDTSCLLAEAVFNCLDNRYNINTETQSIRSIQMTDSTEDISINKDNYIQTLAFEIK